MAFRVEIEPRAFQDIDSIANFIKAKSSFEMAERWFNGIINDIASLKDFPARCPIAPESEELGIEVRILFHGRKNRSYKVYFTIDHEAASSGTVRVFHVRHWSLSR